MSVICISIGVSGILQPFVAMWILSYDWSIELYEGFAFRPWRLLLFIFTSTGVVGFIMLLMFPESPKFYMSIGQNEKTFEVLQWMQRTNKAKPLNFNQIAFHTERNNDICDDWRSVMKSMYSQIVPLMKPPFLFPFLACCTMMFGVFANVGGLALFLPDTLNQLRKSNITNALLCEILQNRARNQQVIEDGTCDDSVDVTSLTDYVYLGIAYVFGFVVLSFVTKRLGRQKISSE